MMHPKIGTIWRFVGKGPGHGEKQRVIDVDELEVVTITEPEQKLLGSCGPIEHSWLGPLADFAKNFLFLYNEN